MTHAILLLNRRSLSTLTATRGSYVITTREHRLPIRMVLTPLLFEHSTRRSNSLIKSSVEMFSIMMNDEVWLLECCILQQTINHSIPLLASETTTDHLILLVMYWFKSNFTSLGVFFAELCHSFTGQQSLLTLCIRSYIHRVNINVSVFLNNSFVFSKKNPAQIAIQSLIISANMTFTGVEFLYEVGETIGNGFEVLFPTED